MKPALEEGKQAKAVQLSATADVVVDPPRQPVAEPVAQPAAAQPMATPVAQAFPMAQLVTPPGAEMMPTGQPAGQVHMV